MDQFDVMQTLGRGSFGVVRKVKRKADGKTLVAKEMDFGSANDKQKDQIVAEVNILRELRHPFIVRYHDRVVDRRKTNINIIMEYCTTDLGKVIRDKRIRGEYLEESFLWNIFSQVIMALDYCHGRQGREGSRRAIVHRDLKPENVFLNEDNVVKLGDFGLATELSGTQLAESSVGTPYYMSPELINEGHYDERTDVWSLGCLMYEATSLLRPFDADNHMALATKINTAKVPPIPSRYSQELYAAIKWMLNKKRHKRPRVEDLFKIPSLQLPLHENRLIVREFELQQRYAQRFQDLERRESDMARREAQRLENLQIRESDIAAREAKLAESEASLLRRAEALALLEQEISARISRTAHDAYSSPRKLERMGNPLSSSPSHWQPGSRLRRWESGAAAGTEVTEAGGGSPWRREDDGEVGGERARGVGGGGGRYVPMEGAREAASPSSKGSEPRHNVTEATTAVLEYASFILHKPAHCKDRNSGENCRRAAEPQLAPPRMDDTILLDAYETHLGTAVPATEAMSPQEHRGHRRARVSTIHDGVVSVEKAGRIWQADELYTKEAVAAAGRKARESYAGYLETISAARDLGTWESAKGKENLRPHDAIARADVVPFAETTEASGGYRPTSYRVNTKDAVRPYASRRRHQRRASDVPACGYAHQVPVASPAGLDRVGEMTPRSSHTRPRRVTPEAYRFRYEY